MTMGLKCNYNQRSLPYENKCKMLHFQIVCITSVKYFYKYRLQGSIILRTRSPSILRDEHGWEQPDLVTIPELSPSQRTHF